MKTNLLVICLLLCTTLPSLAQDGIYYISLNRAVRLGHYDGVRSLQEAKKHGNFGLGSVDKIAAELVMINDTAYQLSADGKSTIMDPKTMLPFAAVKFFTAEKKYTLEQSLTLEQLQHSLDSLLNKNAFAAIRINGQFNFIEYFCYLPQAKPYPIIEQAEKKVTTHANVSGTLVGFYTPGAAGAINSPVYHFHFINAARNSGGHVQNCLIRNVTVEIDLATELTIALPDPAKMEVNLR